MAIPEYLIRGNPELQQAALQVQNDIDNSVQPQMGVIPQQVLPPENQVPVQPEEPGILDSLGNFFSMDSAPQTEGYENAPEGSYVPQSNSTAGGVLSNLANLFSDPAFLQSAMAFGDSMAGNQQGFQSNMNAYASTMADRRAAQAKSYEDKLKRQLLVADRAEERQWQEKNDYRNALTRMYTPESVEVFMVNEDPTVLEPIPMTQYQTQSLDQSQQRIDNEQAENLMKYSSSTQARLNGMDPSNNGMGTIALTKQGKPAQSAGVGIDGQEYFMGTNNNYVWTASGKAIPSSEFQSRGRTITEASKADNAISGNVDSIDSAITQLSTTKNAMDAAMSPRYREGRENAQGPINSRIPTVRGNTADYEARIETLRGNTFLQQRQQLKGQGAITDYESGRAEAAWGTLTNPRASIEEQNKAYEEMTNIINLGLERLQAKRSQLETGSNYGRNVSPVQQPSNTQSTPTPSTTGSGSLGQKYGY